MVNRSVYADGVQTFHPPYPASTHHEKTQRSGWVVVGAVGSGITPLSTAFKLRQGIGQFTREASPPGVPFTQARQTSPAATLYQNLPNSCASDSLMVSQ